MGNTTIHDVHGLPRGTELLERIGDNHPPTPAEQIQSIKDFAKSNYVNWPEEHEILLYKQLGVVVAYLGRDGHIYIKEHWETKFYLARETIDWIENDSEAWAMQAMKEARLLFVPERRENNEP